MSRALNLVAIIVAVAAIAGLVATGIVLAGRVQVDVTVTTPSAP